MAKDYVPPYPFVEIVWDDAASNTATWVSTADISGVEQVITRGFLVKETDKFVCIASSVSNESEKEDTVGNTISIPLGMIVSRRELRLSTKRPPKPKATSDA